MPVWRAARGRRGSQPCYSGTKLGHHWVHIGSATAEIEQANNDAAAGVRVGYFTYLPIVYEGANN